MNKAYEITQGLLSWVAFLAFGVAFPFTLEAMGVLNAMSFDQYVAETALIFVGVFALAMVVKMVMAISSEHFWLRIRLANKLHAVAEKIDPRRRGN